MDRVAKVVCLCTALLLLSVSSAESQVLDVRTMMTPAEFRSTGLTKLTADELQELNQWLDRLAARLLEVASDTAIPSTGVVESRIAGEFTGWDGETVFVLDNGQIWQQSQYAYHYHYAYRPRVLIYPSGGRYRMKVDGVTQEIFVQRLR